VVSRYFATTYTRMPILSRARFYDRLPSVYSAPSADFLTLCLYQSRDAEPRSTRTKHAVFGLRDDQGYHQSA
jgi:hypothetical protein